MRKLTRKGEEENKCGNMYNWIKELGRRGKEFFAILHTGTKDTSEVFGVFLGRLGIGSRASGMSFLTVRVRHIEIGV